MAPARGARRARDQAKAPETEAQAAFKRRRASAGRGRAASPAAAPAVPDAAAVASTPATAAAAANPTPAPRPPAAVEQTTTTTITAPPLLDHLLRLEEATRVASECLHHLRQDRATVTTTATATPASGAGLLLALGQAVDQQQAALLALAAHVDPSLARELERRTEQLAEARRERALHVLEVVLDNLRLASREARKAEWRKMRLFARQPQCHSQHRAEWNAEDPYRNSGCADDDGEDGASAGGGWRRRPLVLGTERLAAAAAAPASSAPSGEPQSFWDDGARALPPRVLHATAAAAARVSRAWRGVAMRAVDVAFVPRDLTEAEWPLGPSRPVLLPVVAFDGTALRTINVAVVPTDRIHLIGGEVQLGPLLPILERLLDYRGGALRALELRRRLDRADPLACALGLAEPEAAAGGEQEEEEGEREEEVEGGARGPSWRDLAQTEHGCRGSGGGGGGDGDSGDDGVGPSCSSPAPSPFNPPPSFEGVARVLSGIRVLRMSGGPGLPLRPRPGFKLPSPSPLRALVTLCLQDVSSRAGPRVPGGRRRKNLPCFLSGAFLPSLRVLDVNVIKNSDCPVWIDPLDPPPRLRALRALRSEGTTTALFVAGSYRWPRREPFLVCAAGLSALGSTLESLSLQRPTYASWTQHMEASGRDSDADDDENDDENENGDDGAPLRASDFTEITYRWAHSDVAALGGPPPSSIAPLARMAPAFASPVALTRLELESAHDWRPAPAFYTRLDDAYHDDDEQEEGDSSAQAAARRARAREWRAAARLVFFPMRATLRHLKLAEGQDDPRNRVRLPPALSTLSALTALEVDCGELRPVASSGLRSLTNLQRLWLRARLPRAPTRHAPVLASDLQPLTQLKCLYLSECAPCIAPIIEHGLPQLRWLHLRTNADGRGRSAGGGSSPLPLAVIVATVNRVTRVRLNVMFERIDGDSIELLHMMHERVAAGPHAVDDEAGHALLHGVAQAKAAFDERVGAAEEAREEEGRRRRQAELAAGD